MAFPACLPARPARGGGRLIGGRLSPLSARQALYFPLTAQAQGGVRQGLQSFFLYLFAASLAGAIGACLYHAQRRSTASSRDSATSKNARVRSCSQTSGSPS